MCFIIDNDGKIEVTKEGMQLPEILALYKTDKREGKSFFKKCITYIFYVYNPEGIYKNLLPRIKRKKVCDTYLAGEDWKGFEENKHVQEVIKTYVELQTLPSERLLIGTITSIDGMLERMNKIPLTKTITIEVEHEDKSHKVYENNPPCLEDLSDKLLD